MIFDVLMLISLFTSIYSFSSWTSISFSKFSTTASELSLFSIDNIHEGDYYIYEYSQIYSSDAFLYFKENGLFNRELGNRFRKEVLEMNSEQTIDKCYEIFRGNKPNPKSLLKIYE